MKNVRKSILVKVVVPVVVLVGVGALVFVMLRGGTSDESLGSVNSGNLAKSAKESYEEPMGATEEAKSDESDENDGAKSSFGKMADDILNKAKAKARSGGSGVVKEAENTTNIQANNAVNNEQVNGNSTNTNAQEVNDAEEQARREEEERRAREEAERLAHENQSGVYAPSLTNTYPWQADCPEGRDTYVTVMNGIRIGGNVCECTSYVGWKVYEKYGIGVDWGNANAWSMSAATRGLRVDNVPEVGSAGQVNTPPYGHVFWVESINSDGSIVVSEYNVPYSTYLYSGDSHSADYGARTIPASNAGQYNYIHFGV